jgi:hypothetical protein
LNIGICFFTFIMLKGFAAIRFNCLQFSPVASAIPTCAPAALKMYLRD